MINQKRAMFLTLCICVLTIATYLAYNSVAGESKELDKSVRSGSAGNTQNFRVK